MPIKKGPDKKYKTTSMENLKKATIPVAIDMADNMYDLTMLEEMDDTEYLLDVLTTLLKETPTDLKGMKDALQAGKIDIVCKQAHKLKSSAGVIQAEKLTTLLADIEAMGKKGAINNELICLVEYAMHEYGRIEKALKIYVQGFK